jgi:serine/threonine protein kinase
MKFIQYLLNPDMNERPTAEEALKHPFLSNVNHKNLDKSQTESVLQNMSNFKPSSLIHKLLYNYIGVHRVPSVERRNVDAIWNSIDVKKKGTLSKKTLKKFFNSQGKILNDNEID